MQCFESTIPVLLNDAIAQLKVAGVDTPELDARLLLQSAANITHTEIISGENFQAPADSVDKFKQMIERRIAREPVSRICGHREIWGLDLEISPAVLDPRPDTERLIETVLEWVDEKYGRQNNLRIADVGTGSGAIILPLLHELPNTTAVATDISALAIEQALTNAGRLGLDGRIEFVRGSWCEPLVGRFDVIVSNPPYIKTSIIPTLALEVYDYDPLIALDGGNDGLDAYRALLAQSADNLEENGQVFLEIGFDQALDVISIARQFGWKNLAIIQDITGNDRVFAATR